MKKKWKRKFQKKKPEKYFFLGGCEEKMFFVVKMSFFGKIGKHYLCSDSKNKRAFTLQLSVFGKWSFFCGHSKWQNTIKKGFQQAQGKTQNGTFGCKNAILGKGPRKGFYYLWFLKAVFCRKHYFYSVFSKTQLCRHERAKKRKNKNRGGLPEWTKVFFLVLFGVLVVLFFWFLCVSVLLFCTQ